MTTIAALADQLISVCDTLAEGAASASRIASALRRLEGLEDAAEELDDLLVPMNELALVEATVDLPERLSILAQAPDIEEGMAWLGAEDSVNYRDLVRGVANDLRSALADAWTNRLEAVEAPTASRTVLHALEGLGKSNPVVMASVAVIRKRSDDLAEMQRTDTPEEGEGAALLLAEHELKRAWASIHDSGVPEDRLELLERLGSVKGVPISEVTDDQIAWLREAGLAGDFALRRSAM
ncbi:hypothetical protein DVS28_a0335 [Euzebya pacifica]|uniref:Uncharacterized protein n=1 Tax=Euzebya pacifica TaxID=1608957 RepID=A0A346XS45_9ACTN|nr:hypothetical protein [Euzebya pacifica]AXV05042.1 hypothetical protein DVS28_a0335 [Euzebya pacifica]